MGDRVRSLAKLLVLVALVAVVVYKLGWPGGYGRPGQAGRQGATPPAGMQELPRWLLFHSETCAPCREMRQVFALLQAEFAGKIEFVAIDVNDPANREMVTTYNIRYVPASYLLDRHGKLFCEQVGALPVGEMRAKLEALLGVP